MKVRTISKDDFGPKNKEEAMVYAEEKFRVYTQYAINVEMDKRQVSEQQLRHLLNADNEFMTRIFETGDITIRELAKIFYVLGKECRLVIDDKND